MNKKINLALVGFGFWGKKLYNKFSNIDGCQVKVVCDSDVSVLKDLKCVTCINYDDILNDTDLDGVVIATPPKTHFRVIVDSLLSGKHVFVEKPSVLCYRDAEIIRDFANEHNFVLMTDLTYLYSPHINYLKTIIDKCSTDNEFKTFSMKRMNLGIFDININVVYDLAPHDLSILLHLFGANSIKNVSCTGSCSLYNNVIDTANIRIELINSITQQNIQGNVELSWYYPEKIRSILLNGSRRSFYYSQCPKNGIIENFIIDQGTKLKFKSINTYIEDSEPLCNICYAFVDNIRNNNTNKYNLYLSTQVSKIIDAVNESMKNNGERITIE